MGHVTFDFSCPVNEENLRELRRQVPNAQHFERQVGQWLRHTVGHADKGKAKAKRSPTSSRAASDADQPEVSA